MRYRFDYRHVALALLATLVLAGLFYLPYLAVRNKTVEAFRVQQTLLAQQAGSGLQEYATTYEKALVYLVQQPAIQSLDEGGKALLRDFWAIHPQDIAAIQRLDASGASLFAVPEKWADDPGAKMHCSQIRDSINPEVSDLLVLPDGSQQVYFSASVYRNEHFDGCISFFLPFSRVANRYLEQIPLHHQTTILLFSQGGDMLAAPEEALVGKSSHHLQGTSNELALLRAAVIAGEQRILTLSRTVGEGGKSRTEKVYAVIHPVVLPGDTRWSMVLLTPAKEVLGAMSEFRSQWLMVTAIAAAAVGLLSLVLSGIVSRRREEQRLRAEEEQLAGLLDLAPMGFFLVDGRRHTVLYANRKAQEMIGPDDSQEVLGRSFVDFLHWDSQEKVVDGITQPWDGQAIRIEAVQFVGFSGIVRDVVITATPYRTGTQPQFLLLVRDVTEERRTAARQRRLIEAVDQVKEAVLIADSKGTIDYVNATLGEMTGYGREECAGKPVRMLWAKEQEAHFEQKMGSVVEQGETWQGRIVNQRKDGSLFVAAATVSPMLDPNGEVAYFVLVQRDITNDVEIESRMRQAQKMEAIGTLAGGIAHDFNNILGGIIGFTDMALLLCTPGTDVHSNLLHIRQGGKRAADLVQQILTFSRQSAMEKVAVPMSSLIKESLNLMRATLPTTIEIHQDLQTTDATVMAAPVQIQQIVMNLCANAFYAMRETGGNLTIRLERASGAEAGHGEVGGTGWVKLTVADTGQGIESDILPNIFTPFFSTKQPGEGTGMGLSVVHGIVRELGGEISVQSQPDTGSTFTVLLPEADRMNGNLTSSEEPLPMGSEHILVVDDEKEIRETCRMMLSHLGYVVTTTGNPQEVLTLIEQAQPPVDLVLTDQTMPKMTGIDLTGEIRRLRPEIPVILCTGYSDRLNYVIAREAGACDLLMKPMDLRGLGTAVRGALDRHQPGASL
ncbi:PAS domain S-box protein [Desulfobulbus sp.]|uniref:PAS domain-containing hybrid sensor histidine kinase/response regulator n=1 Tax=Desulfobulbus sp. TaxID=895 RepID=UPI00286F56EF|nr:PAS domain S-box protein [Desulfobulbus sp.]